MATVTARAPARFAVSDVSNPVGQAFRILHVGFTVAPILAGTDKFFNLLADWTRYLAPWIPNLLGVSPQMFMYFVGVVEIVAGLLVAFIPRIGAYVVAVWLLGIIVNLLTYPGHLDIALRDLGLMLGAITLGRLAQAHYAETHGVSGGGLGEEAAKQVEERPYTEPRAA
jgi:uncharacterized membrane protein YphA (DoxX/SURF4 family)